MTASYDVIIVGGGTMGLGAAWSLSSRGIRTLVLEQYSVPHTFGSHGGQTRIFRHAYAEGAEYMPLMARSEELWEHLQAETGSTFLHRTGILEMDGPGGDVAKSARSSAEQHGVPYEWLDAAEIQTRWPQFTIGDEWVGGFSERAGFFEVEPALKGMLEIARRSGAVIRSEEPVISWSEDKNQVTVQTVQDRYVADELVLTAGSWMPSIARSLGLPLEVIRKTVFWLEVETPSDFSPDVFPVFAAVTGRQAIYGFPLHGKEAMKIADHFGGTVTTAEDADRVVHDREHLDVYNPARNYLPALTEKQVDACVCLYTRTPDEHFIIDRHPDHPRAVIACGFSGHGFKFAPAIGEHIADLCTDKSSNPFDLFAMARFTSTRASA